MPPQPPCGSYRKTALALEYSKTRRKRPTGSECDIISAPYTGVTDAPILEIKKRYGVGFLGRMKTIVSAFTFYLRQSQSLRFLPVLCAKSKPTLLRYLPDEAMAKGPAASAMGDRQ